MSEEEHFIGEICRLSHIPHAWNGRVVRIIAQSDTDPRSFQVEGVGWRIGIGPFHQRSDEDSILVSLFGHIILRLPRHLFQEVKPFFPSHCLEKVSGKRTNML